MDQEKLQLVVVKAAFSATFNSPGEGTVPTQLISNFQALLASACSQPSQRNIKEARMWLLDNCRTEKQVTTALRFISAFSATQTTFKATLALLYVLNDVLYHAFNTFQGTSKTLFVSAAVQYLPELVKSIRSAPGARVEPLERVLKLWSENQYFSIEELAKIKGGQAKEGRMETHARQPHQKPLVKPSMIGLDNDPHWLLPVSCMLEDADAPYTPIEGLRVQAIKLCNDTDPSLLKSVDNFEFSIRNWKFTEEPGSKGEEFDGEGWNKRFWNDRAAKELKLKQENIRQRAMEKIARMGDLRANRESGRERQRSPSPDRLSRSWTQSANSRSRSPSPLRRERSYSRSPPLRKRPHQRSPTRSVSPKGKRSPPSRGKVQGFAFPHQTPPAPYPGPPVSESQYSYNVPNLQETSQAYENPRYHQNPSRPSGHGFYRIDTAPQGAPSAPWSQRAPVLQQSHWQQAPPSGPSESRNASWSGLRSNGK